jgi:hypothetical protein
MQTSILFCEAGHSKGIKKPHLRGTVPFISFVGIPRHVVGIAKHVVGITKHVVKTISALSFEMLLLGLGISDKKIIPRKTE